MPSTVDRAKTIQASRTTVPERRLYAGNHKNGEIEISEQVVAFQNRFATLYNDEVIFPSGSRGQYLRFSWNSPYGVMLFAVDAQDRLLLVHNFRHDTRAWHWQIPSGFGEKGLSPLVCAQKELSEETGYQADQWEVFRSFSQADMTTLLFKARLGSLSETQREEGEAISHVGLFTKQQCRAMLMNNQMVTDPYTLFVMTAFIMGVEADAI